MERYKQVINSDKLVGFVDLPPALKGRMVEVIIQVVKEKSASARAKGSAFGILQQYANPVLITQEKGAWGEAVWSNQLRFR